LLTVFHSKYVLKVGAGVMQMSRSSKSCFWGILKKIISNLLRHPLNMYIKEIHKWQKFTLSLKCSESIFNKHLKLLKSIQKQKEKKHSNCSNKNRVIGITIANECEVKSKMTFCVFPVSPFTLNLKV